MAATHTRRRLTEWSVRLHAGRCGPHRVSRARDSVTIRKKARASTIKACAAAIAALVMVGVTGRAQQAPADGSVQIPQPVFRAPEDVFKTGVKPVDIKPGVGPDFKALRDPLV